MQRGEVRRSLDNQSLWTVMISGATEQVNRNRPRTLGTLGSEVLYGRAGLDLGALPLPGRIVLERVQTATDYLLDLNRARLLILLRFHTPVRTPRRFKGPEQALERRLQGHIRQMVPLPGVGLRFVVTPVGAVWVSTLWAIGAGRWRLCRRCWRFFLTAWPKTRLEVCERCDQRPGTSAPRYATGLEPEALTAWRRVSGNNWKRISRQTRYEGRTVTWAKDAYSRWRTDALARLREMTLSKFGAALHSALAEWEREVAPSVARGRAAWKRGKR